MINEKNGFTFINNAGKSPLQFQPVLSTPIRTRTSFFVAHTKDEPGSP